MTPSEINLAIALSEGWRLENPAETRDNYKCWVPPGKNPIKNCRYTERPKDYYGSLDAIVPVIRAMTDDEQWQVILKLRQIPGREFAELSTPEQWCEAFLKAKSLWQ